MLPLIDRTQATLGSQPAEVLADAGYRGEATFQTLEARGIRAYISLGHEVRPSKPPNPAHVATQRMAARLASDPGRARYRRRKAVVEPVLGWIPGTDDPEPAPQVPHGAHRPPLSASPVVDRCRAVLERKETRVAS